MSSVDYAGEPASVARARAFVAGMLDTAPDELRDRAVLITSELATNAVLHARTDFTVTATLADHEVRVAVTDHRGGLPVARQPAPDEPHGRGLLIADRLSDDWGIEALADATTVWFALTLAP